MSHREVIDSMESTFSRVPMVLLAGGRGTRLGPLTESVPKALVDVAGRPFIDYQLEIFRRAGIRRVVVCVGYRGEQIISRLGDGSRFGLEIAYESDGPSPLGTGGAIRQAAHGLPDLFWVSVGDMLLDVDYRRIFSHFLRTRKPALMTVIPNKSGRVRNNVLMHGQRLVRYDKRRPTRHMAHVDSGLALLRRSVLSELPPHGPADLADLFMRLSERGEVEGHEMVTPFRDIGNPPALAKTREHIVGLRGGRRPVETLFPCQMPVRPATPSRAGMTNA